MAFVNEFISRKDLENYGIKEIDKRFMKVTFQPDWTVDKERNVYLRFVGSGREEFATEKECTLYWRGTLLTIQLDQQIAVAPGGEKLRHYKLLQLNVPDAIAVERAEIILGLKDALIAYQGGGVYSGRSEGVTIFDF